MKQAAAIATGLALVLVAAPVRAQTAQDNDNCHGRNNASYDSIIAGCSAMIQYGHLTGPDLANLYYNRGLAHSLKREYDPAIQDLDQVLKISANDAEALAERGADYFGKQDFDHALADFDQSISLDPKSFRTYQNRGAVYNAKGLYDKAVADFTQAINLNAGIAQIYYSRAIAYDKLGQHDNANADYAKAAQLDPTLKRPQ
jgi:tetratricopeptide (TPR) repeat protein